MKTVMWYWIIGCIVFGLSSGSTLERCPNMTVHQLGSEHQVRDMILVWPYYITTVFFSKSPMRECSSERR